MGNRIRYSAGMIQLDYHDRGAERLAEIEAVGWEAIQRCTVLLWTECVRAVGVPNPRPYTTPSREGEPPRLRTAHGQRNIAYDLDQTKGVGRVGVRMNAKYMAMLDRGTRHTRPRPWLLFTARKIWPRLQALAQGKRK